MQNTKDVVKTLQVYKKGFTSSGSFSKTFKVFEDLLRKSKSLRSLMI